MEEQDAPGPEEKGQEKQDGPDEGFEHELKGAGLPADRKTCPDDHCVKS
jgi:hypothetical protein